MCKKPWSKQECSFHMGEGVNRLNEIQSNEELSFLLGYYSHLITDAELQRTILSKESDRFQFGKKLSG